MSNERLTINNEGNAFPSPLLRAGLPLLTLIAIFAFLSSCTSKPQSGYFANSPPLPDSAKVKAVIYVPQATPNGVVTEKLSAVLFAVPNKKYRLELSGIFGVSAASLLWSDGEWKAVFPQDERYISGNGDCVTLPIYGGADIHKFVGLFLGQKADNLSCAASQNLKVEYRENSAAILRGADTLTLEIKSIDAKAEWKSGVWNLPVPEGYIPLVFSETY